MNNKILIIDNDLALTTQLEKYLGNEGFELCCCDSALEGFNKANTGQFSLIILDIATPNFDGFELLKLLIGIQSCPVMIMTTRDEHFDRIYALEVGADDYLLKHVNHRELLARIKVVMRRGARFTGQLTPNKINIDEIRLNRTSREVYCEQHLLKLTGSEFEVLSFLMSNAGKVHSKETIGKYAFGRTISYYDRSIDMHISNIRKKIARHRDKPSIKTVRGVGYTFLMEQGHHNLSAYGQSIIGTNSC